VKKHNPPNEKCDVAEFGDRTTSHPVTENPETKSKDHNMTDTNTKQRAINFSGFMALPDGHDCLDSFAGNLSDNGVEVPMYLANEFCEDEDAVWNMSELSHFLIAYGRWMEAKVKAFEVLETMGFEPIKAVADCCATISTDSYFSGEYAEGEWCRLNGVIYVSYAGKVDASISSLAKRKREREKEDLSKAKFMLGMLHEHVKTVLAA